MKLFAMIIFLCSSLVLALDKANFDIKIPSGMAKSSASQQSSKSVIIKNDCLECCVLPGGYFTFGTTGGTATSSIDDNSPILFGHPYAKTSYPLFRINNSWGRIEDFCNLSDGTFTTSSSKVVYTCPVSNVGIISITYDLSTSLNNTLSITSDFSNTSTDSIKNFQYAIVTDPGIGISSGDGTIEENGLKIVKECKLVNDSLLIKEQCSGAPGINITANFQNAFELFAANWNTVKTSDNSGTPEIKSDNLMYDLCIKALYKPQSIGPSKNYSQSVQFMYMPFTTPAKLFVRLDIPRFLDMHNGSLYPQNLQSKCIIYNTSGTDVSLKLSFSLPQLIELNSGINQVTVGANSSIYLPESLTVFEHYNKDTTCNIIVTSDQLSDSLITPVYLPASPFSYKGLNVKIDSLVSKSSLSRKITFKAFDSISGSYLYGLKNQNIFLYENGSPINSFALTKDTTGGKANLDVVFVLDVTGSMSEEITAVKTNLNTFVGNLTQKGVNYRIGMVTFLDNVENVYQPTTDVDAFRGYIDAQFAHGGDDEPENSLEALSTASDLTLRPNAKTIFIWITDATYHNPISNFSVQSVVSKLTSKDITVFSIGPTNLESVWYQPIYNVTGGKFFDINGNFQDILLDIANLRFSSNYLLTYNSTVAFDNLNSIIVEIHNAGSGGSDTLSFSNNNSLKKVSENTLSIEPVSGRIVFTSLEIAKISLSIFNIQGKKVYSDVLNVDRKNGQVLNYLKKPLARGCYVYKLGWLNSDKKTWQFKSQSFSIIN